MNCGNYTRLLDCITSNGYGISIGMTTLFFITIFVILYYALSERDEE